MPAQGPGPALRAAPPNWPTTCAASRPASPSRRGRLDRRNGGQVGAAAAGRRRSGGGRRPGGRGAGRPQCGRRLAVAYRRGGAEEQTASAGEGSPVGAPARRAGRPRGPARRRGRPCRPAPGVARARHPCQPVSADAHRPGPVAGRTAPGPRRPGRPHGGCSRSRRVGRGPGRPSPLCGGVARARCGSD